MRRNRFALVLTASVLSLSTSSLVASCSTSSSPPGTPIDVSTIAGVWQGDGIALTITDDGTVHYMKSTGGNTSLKGLPLSDLTSTGFDVAVFGIGTHFVIDALPYQVGDATKMRVDGFELTKRTAPIVPDTAALDAVDADTADEIAPPPMKVAADTVLPPPGTLASLVGVWSGPDMRLTIGADGVGSYAKTGMVKATYTGAKVVNITATSFELELIGGLTSTFVVDKAPAVVDGVITMTVDGVVLQRS
ncbi:MAG TPA: hypothetical protein VGF99_03465 [Myxococcota bacterium]